MKLDIASIKNENWTGYSLPAFDIKAVDERTKKEPIWLHMGAGNIFRIFPAVMQQDLIEANLSDKGIIVCECYDEEIVPTAFTPYDNLTLAVTLKSDGSTDKKVVASVAEAITAATDRDRLLEVCSSPSLQMISFTITEKGYNISDPMQKDSMMGYLVAGLFARFKVKAPPLALVSMDNVARNGDVLKAAVESVAKAWVNAGLAESSFIEYIAKLSFPWSMIDKITPRPSADVAALLEKSGYENATITTTSKGTWVSSFVIAEECQYLVIEDAFPNGRPPLEKVGLYFADRETVSKTEKMKVVTCLNPLHTALAISGCLMGYKTIADTMEDSKLVSLLKRLAYTEAMPVVSDPKIIDPAQFLQDVLEKRLTNPFLGDAPQRIVVDTSQKLPIRFGETLKLRREAGLPEDELTAIPFIYALYARYLMGLNDKWEKIPVEPDPRADELTAHMKEPYNLKALFSDASVFGVDLYSGAGVLGKKAERYFNELAEGPGAITRVLEKYWGCKKNDY